MSASNVQTQDANILPPERGKTFPLTADSTARSYDLATLIPSFDASRGTPNPRSAFVALTAVGTDVFFHFRDDAGAPDLSDTAVIAASGGTATPNTLTPNNAYGACLPDRSHVEYRITLPKHRYLVIKTASSTARLDVCVSSHEAGQA